MAEAPGPVHRRSVALRGALQAEVQRQRAQSERRALPVHEAGDRRSRVAAGELNRNQVSPQQARARTNHPGPTAAAVRGCARRSDGHGQNDRSDSLTDPLGPPRHSHRQAEFYRTYGEIACSRAEIAC
jgi:hypothetical protein